MLRRRKLPEVAIDQYRDDFEFPVINYYKRLGFDLENEPFNSICMEFIEEYEKRKFECGLQQDAPALLREISNKGLPQSILSAYEKGLLTATVRHFNIDQYFNNIEGLPDYSVSNKIGTGKALVKQFDCRAGEVLLIGDTVHDYEVSIAIGADCLLVADGHHPQNKLEACGVKVAGSLSEALDMTP